MIAYNELLKLSLTTIACFAMASMLAAKPNGEHSIPRSFLPVNILPQPTLSPEEKATIERARQDLKSSNTEHRVGAVMLLGKYESLEARMPVVEALADPEVRVRQAALVSVGEWNRGAPFEAVVPVLRLVGDEDVGLRRTASAAIPTMMAVKRSQEMIRPGTGQRLPADVEQILIAAYLDEDVIVRRNLLSHHYFLNLPVPGETFLALMDDEDGRVRLEVVGLAARFAEPKAFADKAARWIVDGDRAMRLSLAREVANFHGMAQLELLRQLAEDEDDEIAAEALLGRFRQLGSRPVFLDLLKRLQDGRIKQEQAVRFIQMMRLRREDAVAYMGKLTELQDPILRREVARLFFDLGFAPGNPEQVKSFLSDPSQEIRSVAISHLELRVNENTPELMDFMLASEYPDVRLALTQMLQESEGDKADELLLDLLLDEQTAIRLLSLREIVGRRVDGWQDILGASLEDPDFQMQRQAVELMMRYPAPAHRDSLVEYVREHPKSPLVPHILKFLKFTRGQNGKETL